MFGKNENIVSMIEHNGNVLVATNRRIYVLDASCMDDIRLLRLDCKILEYSDVTPSSRPDSDSEISDSGSECDHDYQIGDIEGEPAMICIKCQHIQSED